MALVLAGFMGAGKSTRARELDPEAADTDALVEARLGRPVAEVFATDGEAAFRAVEEEVVLEALDRHEVAALGGGSVLSERVRAALREGGHTTVLLEVEPDVAWARVRRSDRPLARDREAFEARWAERRPLYEAVADVVAWRGFAREEVAAAGEGRRVLLARTGGPVVVGEGALRAGRAALAGRSGLGGRTFCISDETVADLHLGRAGDLAGVVEIPPGEQHKLLSTCERVWQALAAQGATRSDHVLALGGGVVGDLGGFVAACYQRGVPVVQGPTTLVAMVDSAYGGKTGVDLPEAKNYVGAYHQPAAVLVEPQALSTLPAEEFAAGYAEVLKTALIAGGALWDHVREGRPVDDDVLWACARTKLAVVDADERDGGRRQVLNLGHTVGHALEVVAGLGVLRHGEAVGIGLLAALRLSGQDALREEVRGLLEHAGLPLEATGVDPEAVVAATALDKKRLAGAPTPFVLVRAPGDVVHGQPVDPADLRAAVAEVVRPG
jgi:shikimate kinase / 3-dehydroquinate synthase